MSIVTSREEHAAAEARLAGLPTEVLERDLIHWEVASIETGRDYEQLERRLHQLRDLHQEERTWVALHAEEIRKRRSAGREERHG